MKRVLIRTAATVDVTFTVDGEPTNVDDGGVPTVKVRRGDGTILLEGPASETEDEGRYELALAPVERVDRLTLDWTGTISGVEQTVTTVVEVAGGFLVPVVALRSAQGMSQVPVDKLLDGRRWWEDVAESACEVAWVPRYAREVLDGTSRPWLRLRRPLITPASPVRELVHVAVDGEPEDLDGWHVTPTGRVTGPGPIPSGRRNVEVGYAHGHDQPPVDLQRAAVIAVRAYVIEDRTGVESRMTSIRNEFGDRVFVSVAGEDRPTGIPEVDAVLVRHAERLAVMA